MNSWWAKTAEIREFQKKYFARKQIGDKSGPNHSHDYDHSGPSLGPPSVIRAAVQETAPETVS
jgi:hypothetical protein